MPNTNYELKCYYCGAMFQGSRYQVSKFRRSGGTKKVCCSPDCVREHRAQNAKKMHEQGRLKWGSPAQIKAFSRSGPLGERAHNWKGGKHSAAEKAASKERGAAMRAARDAIRPTCARCGLEFKANSGQRVKYRSGEGIRFFCPECRVHPSYHLYRVNSTFDAADEAGYYADAECTGCNVVFTPNPAQRTYRLNNKGRNIYCTDECRKHYMPKGECSPGWKHGFYSVPMKQVRVLRHKIKKLIEEGADQ